MALRRTNRCNDTLANSGNNRFFACTADQSAQIRSHCYLRNHLHLDAINRNGRNPRCFDNLRRYAHFYSFKNIPPCQVNRCRTFKGKIQICSVRRNQSIYNVIHTTAGKQMGFQLICVNIHSGFLCLDQRANNLIRTHPTQTHPDQRKNIYPNSCGNRGNP